MNTRLAAKSGRLCIGLLIAASCLPAMRTKSDEPAKAEKQAPPARSEEHPTAGILRTFPKDGSWVRYRIESEQTDADGKVTRRDPLARLTILVGSPTETEKTAKFVRWIELVHEYDGSDGQTIQDVRRLQLSKDPTEKHDNLLDCVTRVDARRGLKGKLSPAGSYELQPSSRANFVHLFSGRLIDFVSLPAKPLNGGPLGSVKALGIEGRNLTGVEGDKNRDVYLYQTRWDDKVPTGVVWHHCVRDFTRQDGKQLRQTWTLQLDETGENGISLIE